MRRAIRRAAAATAPSSSTRGSYAVSAAAASSNRSPTASIAREQRRRARVRPAPRRGSRARRPRRARRGRRAGRRAAPRRRARPSCGRRAPRASSAPGTVRSADASRRSPLVGLEVAHRRRARRRPRGIGAKPGIVSRSARQPVPVRIARPITSVKPDRLSSVVSKSACASSQTTPSRRAPAPATVPRQLQQLPPSTSGNAPRARAAATRRASRRASSKIRATSGSDSSAGGTSSADSAAAAGLQRRRGSRRRRRGTRRPGPCSRRAAPRGRARRSAARRRKHASRALTRPPVRRARPGQRGRVPLRRGGRPAGEPLRRRRPRARPRPPCASTGPALHQRVLDRSRAQSGGSAALASPQRVSVSGMSMSRRAMPGTPSLHRCDDRSSSASRRGPRPRARVQGRHPRRRRARPRGRARRDLRLPRAQRRRQDDLGAHPHDAAAADLGHRRASRATTSSREADAVRRSIGVALQEAAIDPLMTGRELLRMQGALHGLRGPAARERAAELLERVGLTQAADRRVGGYSGGMRRRLDLALALVHRPRVLFLDEPTTGPGPDEPRRAVARGARAQRRGHDRLPHHAVPRGGRAARRPRRHHRRAAGSSPRARRTR